MPWRLLEELPGEPLDEPFKEPSGEPSEESPEAVVGEPSGEPSEQLLATGEASEESLEAASGQASGDSPEQCSRVFWRVFLLRSLRVMRIFQKDALLKAFWRRPLSRELY